MLGAGKLAANMEAAGIDRHSISKIFLTHAHPDHLWGLLDDFDDTPMFPKASYLITATELDFWLAPDVPSRLPKDRQNFAAGARGNLESIKDKPMTIAPRQEIAKARARSTRPGMRRTTYASSFLQDERA
jgi:glyoxylase-like metal-dependent hydrolase (beta-lactamase superfamily II)